MLKLKNITKSFPGVFKPTLKKVNLELKQSDFCVIIGANGSGKSTLMKVVSGEHSSDDGSVFIDGQDQTNKDRSGFIAQVIQDVNKGTVPEMTLLENMALSKMRTKKARFVFYKRYENEMFQKIKDLEIGMEDYINKPLSSLSGGQRQMIATIMAINSNPKILLLDEHTSALDPKTQQTLMNYTEKSIFESKLTTLMITHKLEDAIRYGNRLIMMRRGEVVFDVSGRDKYLLTTEELLKMFHSHEDLD